MAEEDKLRYLEAMDKVRETGGSGMIIGEILCLFAYIDCTLLFLPLEWWSQPHINEVGKLRRQVWDCLSWKQDGYEISKGG